MDSRRNVADELAYMDHRAPEITPAWSTKGGRYDYDSQRYVPRTASHEVDEATERFKRAQWRYVQSPESLPKGKSFNLESTHSWNEVIEMARNVASTYEQKGRGLHRFLRKSGAALGNMGEMTTAWVQLLPAGDYASVVSGGVKLILTACVHMNDVRMAVVEALDKLPDSVQTPEQYLDLYRSDKELVSAVELLYVTLLRALEKMLAWMEHKTLVHALKALALQASYATSTMESISAIKPVSDKVSAQIEFCFQSRVKDIWRHTTQLSQQVPTILRNAEHAEEQLEEILNRLDAATGLKFMLSENKKMAEWRHQDEERREKEREEDRKRYMEAIQHQQATEQALLVMQQQISRSTTPVNVNVVQYVASPALPAPPPQAALSPSQIFAIVSPNLNTHTEDVDCVISQGSRLQPAETRRGTWLMRQQIFQSWFNSNESRLLLIDGQERDRPVTALSYFIAVLEQGLHDDSDCAVLSYFCGLHHDTESAFAFPSAATLENGIEMETGSPVSIMTSLLGQLLVKTHLSFDTRSLSSELLYDVSNRHLGALCALFRILVTTCRPTTLFILIDSISWLETGSRDDVEDAHAMFAFFQELQSAGSWGSSNVKILLTSPRPSVEFQHHFYEHQAFSMPVAPALSAGGGRFSADHFLLERDAMGS